MWREMLLLQSQWFIHLYPSEFPIKEPSHEKLGKRTVTIHGASCGRKGYIHWDAAWFPKGIIYNTAVTTQCNATFSTIPSTLA